MLSMPQEGSSIIKNGRIEHERPREADTLAQSGGQIGWEFIAIFFKVRLGELPAHYILDLILRFPSVMPQRQCEILCNGNGIEKGGVLKQKTDGFAHAQEASPIECGDLFLVNEYLASIRLQHPYHELQKNGLTCPAAAKNTKCLTTRDLEADTFQQWRRVEGFDICSKRTALVSS